MAAVAETLLEAAVFMREVGSMFCLMAPDDADEDQLEDAEREWFGVSDYLGKATFRVRVALAETRSERPCNLLQRFCAVFALRSLLKFSPQKPTLATDGGLAKLATILYEAATKTTDANLAETCRTVFNEAADPAARATIMAEHPSPPDLPPYIVPGYIVPGYLAPPSRYRPN